MICLGTSLANAFSFHWYPKNPKQHLTHGRHAKPISLMNLMSRGRASLTIMATLHRQALCTKMPQNLNQGHRLSEGTLGSRMARWLILAAKLDRESLFPGTHAME